MIFTTPHLLLLYKKTKAAHSTQVQHSFTIQSTSLHPSLSLSLSNLSLPMTCNLQTSFLPPLIFPKLMDPTFYKRRDNGLVVCSISRTEPTQPTPTISIPTGTTALVMRPLPKSDQVETSERRVISTGKFGRFGGRFVPETLMACLSKLEAEFNLVLHDADFQVELARALRDYVGRETPLYFAQRLTVHYKNKTGGGPEIYLKREDLNHGGSHKINNAIAQAMIAKRLGKTNVVAATGAGQHGIATASACAKLSLKCTILMGTKDMDRQASNVVLMKLLGAEVKSVNGNFKDATSDAIREWVGNLETNYFLMGSAVGPHPCPSMIREFQSVIGKETRRQAMERWGGKPDVLVACVGTGSNALGLFHEFIRDEEVRMIGVEAAGFGLDSGKHSATLARGDVGVFHGAMSYLLQDEEGQIVEPHSIGVGLEYPGVSPELSFLKDTGRMESYTATDQEALDAYQRLCRMEGIFPSLEAAHALAFLEKLCPTLPNGTKVVVNCSGRGDKDADTVFKFKHNSMEQ